MTSVKVVDLGKGEGWALDVGNMTARYSCHHYSGRGYGACGGCYARAMRALEDIQKMPADEGHAMREVAKAVSDECQSEKRGR